MSRERICFYHKPNRRIEPHHDEALHEVARQRLDEIRATAWEKLPEKFKESWDRVALYDPKGSVEGANALILDPDEGAYDLANKLNHLTGKEWIKFTCSWFIFNALPTDLAEERSVDPETASHPATFSPTMISDFIRFFTKEGATVLDPFMGIGTTLVACRRTGRIGYGIELNPKYHNLAIKRVPEFKSQMFCSSAEDIASLPLPDIDFSISSPPYWDVLNRSTKDFKKNRERKDLDVNYSENHADLGNIPDYEEFLDRLCNIYIGVSARLKSKGHLVIVVKNIKKSGKLFPLAWDLGRRLGTHLDLKDEKIWIQDKVSLAPYGYPHSWATNILHHYCLVFQKP